MQGLQTKLEAPILDVMQWATELLDSVYGPVTVMHIRDDIQLMHDEAAQALAQILPLLHAVERQDVRGGINLAHRADNLLQRVRVNYVLRFRRDYAHRLTALHQNILNRIEASSAIGCEYLSRMKSYLVLMGRSTDVNCDYYYLPTILRDFLRHESNVSLSIESAVAEVFGHTGGLRQALKYMLENRRHAGEAAEVHIIAEQTSDVHVRLLILDDGPGIHPEDAGHIFEPFYQANPDDPGLGLGLTLAQRLMWQQAGDIQVYGEHHDASTNQGAAFIFLLPTGVTKPK